MKLEDLVFSDLFVAETHETSWFKPTPDSLVTESVPQDCADELTKLRDRLNSQAGNSDFRVDWPDKTGLRLRVERIVVSDEKTVFVCRRYRILSGGLASLGIPTNIAKKMVTPALSNGLVVFLGKAGSGKSTTASAFIRERLETFGGVCWTVENPIELPLQGRHGKGVCYQTEVESDADIGAAICRLYRATPNIIFIGELREGNSVREAVAAATSGHLVVATFHASDLITGLGRLVRLSGDESVKDALADALRLGMHLELHNQATRPLPGEALVNNEIKNGTGTPPRVLSVEPLFVDDKSGNDAVRANIRTGDIHMLKSEIERQKRLFMTALP